MSSSPKKLFTVSWKDDIEEYHSIYAELGRLETGLGLFTYIFPIILNWKSDKNVVITAWKARTYGIFARVGDVCEIEQVKAANEWDFWYKTNGC